MEESPWPFLFLWTFVSLIAGASSEMEWILCIYQLVFDVHNNAAECHNGWFTRVGMVIKACCTIGGVWYRETPIIRFRSSSKILRVTYHVSTTGIFIGKVLVNSERRECGGQVQAKKCTSDVIRAFKSKPREIPPSILAWLVAFLRFESKPLLSLYSPFMVSFLMIITADRRVFCLIKKQNL